MIQNIDNNEFMLVSHDALNNPDLNLNKTVDDLAKLQKHLNGRKSVYCCEGDLYQIVETGEIVLTHKQMGKLTKKKFEQARASSKAAYLTEMLDKYDQFKIKNDQKMDWRHQEKGGQTGKRVKGCQSTGC